MRACPSPGRPPIGKSILIRLPAMRKLLEARTAPDRPLADTIRRHLDTALNLPDQEKRDTDDHAQ